MLVKIKKNFFDVKVLKDKKSIFQGMKGKRFSKDNNGLLFLMGREKVDFWMKDCVIPLDIIFIKNNKITKIHHNCLPCLSDNCEKYSGEGNIVLEIKGGTSKKLGIEVDDKVEYIIS